MTARGILLVTTAFCGVTAAAAVSQTEAPARPDAANELLDPARVAASACRGANKRNELFKRGPTLAALLAPAEAAAPDRPPLLDDLGTLTMKVTTGSAEAQAYFDQGLRLAFGFNHPEAIRAFEAAQAADPTCAMCYWGEAYALGPNINAPMAPESVGPAFAAIAQAQALAGTANPHEQALIRAMARRYSADPAADRATLDTAFADAMAEVHAGAPGDATIAVLAADAAMNTQPWDFWAVDRRTPKGRTAEILAALERALELDPNHPGAIHLYIHTVEASSTPERAERYAERLATQMPGVGHVVHMPSHIYFRVGRYLDSLSANKAAVAADHAYFEQVGFQPGAYRYGYHPHNVDFLIASARMAGDSASALDASEGLNDLIPDDFAEQVQWVQVIKATPLFAHAQFSEPATVLALPDPGQRFPFVRAMWHYARAVAAAGAGDVDTARTEAEAMERISATADLTGLEEGGVPAADVLRIAALVVDGRIAQAEGDFTPAAEAFGKAAEIQSGLAYMEPPYWYYPVARSEGAALLQAGEAERAIGVFQKSLIDTPNDAYALYGLMRAQRAVGDDAAASVAAERFAKSWAGDGEPDLAGI